MRRAVWSVAAAGSLLFMLGSGCESERDRLEKEKADLINSRAMYQQQLDNGPRGARWQQEEIDALRANDQRQQEINEQLAK